MNSYHEAAHVLAEMGCTITDKLLLLEPPDHGPSRIHATAGKGYGEAADLDGLFTVAQLQSIATWLGAPVETCRALALIRQCQAAPAGPEQKAFPAATSSGSDT